jgi:hypothetical protein
MKVTVIGDGSDDTYVGVITLVMFMLVCLFPRCGRLHILGAAIVALAVVEKLMMLRLLQIPQLQLLPLHSQRAAAAAAWTSSTDMRHRNATRTCSIDMQYTVDMDRQYGHAIWTCKMDIQHEHVRPILNLSAPKRKSFNDAVNVDS